MCDIVYEERPLESEIDFEWYRNKLDLDGRYYYKHEGVPDRYPCKVTSEFWDDPNGPYTFFHSFEYQKTITCEKCGHKELAW